MVSLLENMLILKKKGKVYFDRDSSQRFMNYNGTLENVMGKINSALNESNHLGLFLNVNRLLIGVIDYSLLSGDNLYGLKKEVESFGVEIFKGNYNKARKALENFNLGNKILKSKIIEEGDKVSWAAFDPEIVDSLACEIQDDEFNVDYFVLDGHGAYRPGFMLASYFDSNVCAIRNSKDSGRDKACKFLTGEEEDLNYILNDKNVVVLGEDASTGRALFSLKDNVELISEPSKIFTATSLALDKSIAEEIDYVGKIKSSF